MSKPGVEIGIGRWSTPLPFHQVVAGEHQLVHRRIVDHDRRNGIELRVRPLRVDLLDRTADTDAVDVAVRRQDADGDGNIVFAPLGIDDVLEQEALAIVLVDTATELPAHQRVHFRVLVDRPFDADQQPLLFQGLDVGAQIGITGLLHLTPPCCPDRDANDRSIPPPLGSERPHSHRMRHARYCARLTTGMIGLLTGPTWPPALVSTIQTNCNRSELSHHHQDAQNYSTSGRL